MDTITGILSQICLTEEMADVFFSFKDENVGRLPAHKMILALRSPVFKAMFYGCFPQSEDDIIIEDITLETFQRLVKYLYTDHLQLSEGSVINLLYAAQKYQIVELISKCENYLHDNLAVYNACTVFSNAKLFTMDNLKTFALIFIADNAMEVFKNEDFLMLPSEDLVDILRLDTLCVQEVDVVRAVLKWSDHILTQSSNKINGKSRRTVLLKDGILFTLAIPLLSIDDYISIVIPTSILTAEEQLQICKATSNPSSVSSFGKFRVRPRKGGRVVEVSVNDIRNPNDYMKNITLGMMSPSYTYLQSETLSVKTNNRIKIKSITIKPQFKQPDQNNCNFKVGIKTVDTIPQTPGDVQFYDDQGMLYKEIEEDALNVKFDGRACKLPIDKVIQQNEMLVLKIEPYHPNPNIDIWISNQHMINIVPYSSKVINGMMYQHDISQKTIVYLSLRGVHFVESLEVMELC